MHRETDLYKYVEYVLYFTRRNLFLVKSDFPGNNNDFILNNLFTPGHIQSGSLRCFSHF